MTCYHPQTVWRTYKTTKDGRRYRGITWNPKEALPFSELVIPCGQCIGCRLKRSREWAARCMCELKTHEKACFLTLTYDNEHLPENGSLQYSDFQLFMKRLRRRLDYRDGTKIRVFMCGEYGGKHDRPHYHAIIFGYDFPDKKPFFVSNGNQVYRSPELEGLWKLGLCSVGSVTFESCAYVARYVTKKITGKSAAQHYGDRVPEFCHASTKPGIGRDFCEEYLDDLYTQDRLILSTNIFMNPPRYFDRVLEQLDAPRFEKIKAERRRSARRVEASGEASPARLAVKERIKEMQFDKLVRPLEAQCSSMFTASLTQNSVFTTPPFLAVPMATQSGVSPISFAIRELGWLSTPKISSSTGLGTSTMKKVPSCPPISVASAVPWTTVDPYSISPNLPMIPLVISELSRKKPNPLLLSPELNARSAAAESGGFSLAP